MVHCTDWTATFEHNQNKLFTTRFKFFEVKNESVTL